MCSLHRGYFQAAAITLDITSVQTEGVVDDLKQSEIAGSRAVHRQLHHHCLRKRSKKVERGFKDCVMGLGHQPMYLESSRPDYLVDLISGGVFSHSHGQRGFVRHRYPQLHIGHAVEVLHHRRKKARSE